MMCNLLVIAASVSSGTLKVAMCAQYQNVTREGEVRKSSSNFEHMFVVIAKDLDLSLI